MDPSLLKSHASFRSHASKHVPSAPSTSKPKKDVKKKKKKKVLPENDSALRQMKQSAFTAHKHKNKFRILKILVDYLKSEYLRSSFEPRTLEDLQKLLTPGPVDSDITEWLRQALIENPKVEYDPFSRGFMFKPVLPVRKRSDLARLLRRYDDQGLGGVLMSDVAEALDKPDHVIKRLGDSVLDIVRSDKERIIYYRNPNLDIPVDEDIKALWRGVGVEAVGEADISKYLQNVGLTVMEDTVVRKRKVPGGHQSRAKRKARPLKRQNDHLDKNVLKDYSDKGSDTGKAIQ